MKLAILSRGPTCYSTRRLREAAETRGHEVKVLDTLKFAIDLEQGQPDLYFKTKRLSTYDAVLPRVGASITYFGPAAANLALAFRLTGQQHYLAELRRWLAPPLSFPPGDCSGVAQPKTTVSSAE